MKRKIDLYFTENYNNLLALSNARVCQNRRNYKGAVLVSNCYIYLVERKDEIPLENDIQIWAFKFISSQAGWYNSETNREELEIHRDKVEFIPALNDTSDYSDIDEKIKLEDWYGSRRAALELFREHLRTHDRVRLILLDKMLKERTSSGRKIAAYFRIPATTVWIWFNKIKMDLKEFERGLNK